MTAGRLINGLVVHNRAPANGPPCGDAGCGGPRRLSSMRTVRLSPEQVDLAPWRSCADHRVRFRTLPHGGGRGHTAGKRHRPRVMATGFLQADLRKAAHFPAGHAQSLVNPLDVRGAEVHALPDASVDDVLGDRLPVGVGAGDAGCVRAGQRYGGRRARAEEGVEDSLLRADLAAVAAGVLGVLRRRRASPRQAPGGTSASRLG